MTKATAVKPRVVSTRLRLVAKTRKSVAQEVRGRGASGGLSNPPRGGSLTTVTSKATATAPSAGVTRRAQRQSVATSFTLAPTM